METPHTTRTSPERSWLLRSWQQRPWLLPAGLVLLALTVRWIYIWQAAGSPTFDVPIIDAARYDELARRILAEGRLEASLFWQPSFSPLWLSAVYSIFGPSLLVARLLELSLAGLTCLFTFHLGTLMGARSGLGARPTGALAASIYALWGPAIFFDGELLATGFATLFLVALCLVALRAAEHRRARWFLLKGLLGGLALWCRPELGLAVVLVSVWLLWPLTREALSSRQWRAASRSAALGASLAAGLALVLSPMAILSARHTGRASVLPYSGGLNLWLGNAPDLCQSLTIRPGERWNQLVNEPRTREGLHRPWDQERFFVARTLGAVRQDPGRALANLGRKCLRLVASREIPRNVDLYAAREHSSLLSLLAFRLGAFGFPFGLLLPLAALGLVVARRKIPAPVFLALAGLALALVLVFPAARYRLPMIPLLATLGALGIRALFQAKDTRRLSPLLPGALVALGLLILGSLPGRFCEERGPFAAERYLGAGAYLERHGRPEEALARYAEAVERAPGLVEAQVNLGALLLKRGEGAAALARFDAALAIRPQSAQPRLGRALSLISLGRTEDAIGDLKLLVRLEPRVHGHWFLLGQAQAQAGLFRDAQGAFRTALRLRPDDPETLNALAWIASGRDDPALAHPAEALRLAARACDLTGHQDPSLLDTLAVALEAAGRLDEARARYLQALTLAKQQGKHALTRDIEGRLARLGRLPSPAAPPPSEAPGRP